MRQAREHVRKFWVMQNRRVLGLLFVMFAFIYSVGFVFTTLMAQNFMLNLTNIMLMWAILLAVGIGLVFGTVSRKHLVTTRLMNPKEHQGHSRNIGIFLIAITIGAILFALPVTLVPADASLMMLFSLGGILLLLYTFLNTIFGHSYYEIGFASLALWLVFVVAALSLASTAYANPPLFQSLSFIVASITIITIFALTGAAMLYHTAGSFHDEFKKVNKIK
ncbi:MAG: hypothetical protein KGH53_03395 [Candidatus Micrarchaeota archaeon]|nr:hypothetical protein [Candidatus Micrarchaeota archaeon]